MGTFIIVVFACAVFAAIGFVAGRGMGPSTFPEAYAAAVFEAAEPCGGDVRRVELALLPLKQPMAAGDIADMRQALQVFGYRGLTIENVERDGRPYYFASGCR